MMNKLRKNNKKGFTLVELIVVLVILAILAAFLVPSLTGYIDKAKEKEIIAETRQTVMAAQTIVDEIYATQNIGGAAITLETTDGFTKAAIADLAEVDAANITGVTVADGVVTQVTYTKNGKTCTYTQSTGSYAVN